MNGIVVNGENYCLLGRVGRQQMYIKPLSPTGLAANVKIMPEYFKQAGFSTHAIGKWHLGYCHQNYTPTYR